MVSKTPMRKTTQYTFMVGNIMIFAALAIVVIGLFKGIITENNIVETVALLLLYGSALFGINTARVTRENTSSIKYGRIITDGTPPDPKLKEAIPENPNTGSPIDPMAAFDIPTGDK